MKLNDILPVGLLFVVIAIAISVGADIVQDVNDGQVADSPGGNTTTWGSNISNYGLQSVNEIGSWLPTIGLVVSAAVVISILIGSFAFARF